MKKIQQRTVILLVVLNIAVYGAFGFLYSKNQATAAIDTNIYVSETTMGDINYISIEQGEKHIETEKDENGWVDTKDSGIIINQSDMDLLGEYAKAVPAVRLVSSEGDYAKYGLDNPVETLTVRDTDGNEISYLIGAYNESVNKYYICQKDSKNIYTISKTLGDNLTGALEQYVSAFDFKKYSFDTLQNINIETSIGNTFISRKTDYDKENPLGSNSQWNVEGLKSADSYTLANMYDTIKSIGTNNCYDITPSDTKIDNSTSVFTLNYKTDTEDKKLVVTVGQAEEDGYAYVSFSDSNLLFTVESAALDELTGYGDKWNFVSQSICSINKNNIKSVVAEYGNKTYTFEVNENGYTLNGTPCDSDSFESFYNKLSGLGSITHSDEAEAVETNDKSFKVTFNTTNDKYPVYTEIFTPYDNNYYTAESAEGLKGRLVGIRSVEEVIRLMEEVK